MRYAIVATVRLHTSCKQLTGAVTMQKSRSHPLAMQLTEPAGFWASAAPGRFGQDLARCIPALRADADCPPVVEKNEPALTVTAPVGLWPRVGIPNESSTASSKTTPVDQSPESASSGSSVCFDLFEACGRYLGYMPRSAVSVLRPGVPSLSPVVDTCGSSVSLPAGNSMGVSL